MDKERTQNDEKLWGGRFSGKLHPLMEKFNASIGFDKRLWKADLTASQAYANALQKAELISENECRQMRDALEKIKEEWAEEKFQIRDTDEDVHSANERRLKELIGNDVGGKLHTGRSRNDQVSTDMRLWLTNEIDTLEYYLINLISSLRERAKREIDIIFPGYTHLQRAQPVRWSHWLLSYAWYFQQDAVRLECLTERVNVSPLGSGALAGNPFVDRESLAEELNFSGCTQNSMHAVGDRDFIVEFVFWASLTSVHLSKLAEDLIIYGSKEFGFVTISDSYSTGSSLMPQKKNADGLELIRGKTGRIIGHCTGILVLLKGLPSTFNKDLQEDKEVMFDTYDTISMALRIAAGTVRTLKVNPEACLAALSPDMLATDVAYYLVRKGVAFRKAHECAGKAVALAEEKGMSLPDLSVADLQKISNEFDQDVVDLWDYEGSVERYGSTGGTSRSGVQSQIALLGRWMEAGHRHVTFGQSADEDLPLTRM
uniref:Argininosuccinate lyase n=1 Tax=Centruroides hentzi TaxID=88313 RepID=A0A2I9LNS4_9SCOR